MPYVVSGQDSECGTSTHQHLHVSVGTALAVGRVNIDMGGNEGLWQWGGSIFTWRVGWDICPIAAAKGLQFCFSLTDVPLMMEGLKVWGRGWA